jgi:hypothetical protein
MLNFCREWSEARLEEDAFDSRRYISSYSFICWIFAIETMRRSTEMHVGE